MNSKLTDSIYFPTVTQDPVLIEQASFAASRT